MPQQYSVFYDRKKIDFLHVSSKSDGSILCKSVDNIDWDDFMSFINGFDSCLQSVTDDPECEFRKFSSFFVLHEAAGGLVRNSKGEFLFIFRNGRWDLPKGYIDKGEKPADAALREVREECGIESLTIIKSLPETYHVFPLCNNQWALKKTQWFLMQAVHYQNIVPQLDEGITHAEWRDLYNIADITVNTYANINFLIKQLIQQ